MLNTARLLEESADELARLDVLCELAPRALSAALQLAAVAELARLTDPLSTLDFAQMAAAEGDPLHDVALPSAALHWRTLLVGEEQRVLAGGIPSYQRLAVVAPTLATYPERPRLEAIWRERDRRRPSLELALETAAWCPDAVLGEATAALQLCACGVASRVRLLPFADAYAEARRVAIEAHRAGDVEPWRQLGLSTVARRAGSARRAVQAAVTTLPDEDARLDPLGRAAITTRRGLAHLRIHTVTTMPLLAEALGVSRPAASDVLERLLAAGLVRELTGRARDRVYAYATACAVVDASAASIA